MRHADGIRVTVNRPDGGRIEEFVNPYKKRCEEFKNYLGSRLICSTPETPFELVVEFEPSFSLNNADGVLISIGFGSDTDVLSKVDHNQCFYLDKRHMAIHSRHTISKFTLWTSETGSGQRELDMLIPQVDPQPELASTQWMEEIEPYGANEGCFAIFIERGKLNGTRDNPEEYEWTANDPPTSSRRVHQSTPKVVRGQWFERKRSKSGLEGLQYIFEYRNTSAEDLARVQAQFASTLPPPTPAPLAINEIQRDVDESEASSDSLGVDSDFIPSQARARKRTKRKQIRTDSRGMVVNLSRPAKTRRLGPGNPSCSDYSTEPALSGGDYEVYDEEIPPLGMKVESPSLSAFRDHAPSLQERRSSTESKYRATPRVRENIGQIQDGIERQHSLPAATDSTGAVCVDGATVSEGVDVVAHSTNGAQPCQTHDEDSEEDIEDIEYRLEEVRLLRLLHAAKKKKEKQAARQR